MFKIKFLRNILFLSLAIATILPLFNIFVIRPSLTASLMEGLENEAVSVATHLMIELIPEKTELEKGSLDFKLFDRQVKSFKLMKMKIFSSSGEVIYSTDRKDIGNVNKEKYFFEVVAKGNTYKKLVQKGEKSLEGQRVALDVVETYVPIMRGGIFAGAFEIYYDITPRKKAVDKLSLSAVAVLLGLAFCLLFIIVIILSKAGKTIAERETTDKRLQKERDSARQYFDIAGVILLVINSDQRIAHINKKGCEILGYNEEDIIGKNWFDNFIPENIRNETKAVFEKLVAGKIEAVEYYENPVLTKSGEEELIAWHNTILRDEDKKIIGTLSSGEDITERCKLEAQLQQSQKMESIGTLAGGIAHDFNNILTAIVGYGHLLKMKTKEDDPLREYINQMLASTDRAANLTQSLLAFSRKQIINPRPVNINEIITGIERLLLRIIGEDIELKTILSSESLMIMADAGQIEQVLMNLCANARDAMPDGGILTMETGTVELDRAFLETFEYRDPGIYALISVTDTGRGMNEETQKRIFEPFFTTKDIGKGTGLGLSMAYGIVRQHNGYINCYSEAGRGTTFKIYLPIIQTAADEKTRLSEAEAQMNGTETVLLAEDDEEVRKLTKIVLEEFGYKVIEAADGEEAVSRFLENKDKIKLIIIDVIMPKIDGKEAYERIKKIRPDVKALFTSGYTANLIHKKGILEQGLNFVSKPVSPKELMKRVREALDRDKT